MTHSDLLSLFPFRIEIQLRFADLDAFRHVNNATYLTYCEIARTAYWKKNIKWDWDKMGIIIARSEVDYRIPITLNDRLWVYLKTSKVGTKSFELTYALVSKKAKQVMIHAEAKTVCVCIDYRNNTTQDIPQKQKQIMLKEMEIYSA